VFGAGSEKPRVNWLSFVFLVMFVLLLFKLLKIMDNHQLARSKRIEWRREHQFGILFRILHRFSSGFSFNSGAEKLIENDFYIEIRIDSKRTSFMKQAEKIT
jgi:hypothetical protein